MMTTENQTTTKFHTHTICFLKYRDGSDKPEWIKVGIAWEYDDQKVLNLSPHILEQLAQLVVLKKKSED